MYLAFNGSKIGREKGSRKFRNCSKGLRKGVKVEKGCVEHKVGYQAERIRKTKGGSSRIANPKRRWWAKYDEIEIS